MRNYIAVLLLLFVLALPWFMINYPVQVHTVVSAIDRIGQQFAAIVLARNPKTIAQIQTKYDRQYPTKVRVLLVPGHEPGYGGAEFRGLIERELNTRLAEELKKFLEQNGRYEVFVSRTDYAWSPQFSSYFDNTWDEIVEWQKASRREISHLRSLGTISQIVPTVLHNDAPQNVALRLYGMTKWSNENDIDIVFHIHFNDYPGHKYNEEGKYSGFAIYVPERQFANSTTTRAIANNIFKRLAKYNPTSDLPSESSGIIEEQELIAVGANNTADSASMLIEYAYVFERQLTDPEVKGLAIRDLAFHTYLGLQDFFGSKTDVVQSYDTLMAPYHFNRQISTSGYSKTDVFALQTAMILDGVYPPANYKLNDCPRTGVFGPCTRAALATFQKKYGIKGEKDIVGTQTLQKLNQLYLVKDQ